MSSQYDNYVSNMHIDRIYKSKSGFSYGIAIKTNTDMLKHSRAEWRPIIDQLNENVSKRLDLKHTTVNHGLQDGQTSELGEIRMIPIKDKVTPKQLREAVEAEIKEAKARVAGKKVAVNSVEGGIEADTVTLASAAGKNPRSAQIG